MLCTGKFLYGNTKACSAGQVHKSTSQYVVCIGNLSKSSDEHARVPVVAINFKCVAQNVKCP